MFGLNRRESDKPKLNDNHDQLCLDGILDGNEVRNSKAAILLMWRARLARTADSHYRASDILQKKDKFLTIFNVVSAISVLFFANSETAVDFIVELFVENGNDTNNSKLVVSLAGLLTVISSALQYVSENKELSYRHKNAANEFSNLKRKIERYIVSNELNTFHLHGINREYSAIGKGCPAVPRKIWFSGRTKSVKIVEEDERYREMFDRFLLEEMRKSPI